MKKAKIYLGVISTLLLILSCRPTPPLSPTPTPIQVQALPTWTPPPTYTAIPTVEPTPPDYPTTQPPNDLPPTPFPAAGPLPAVWTDLDFGLPSGDLYLPNSIAIDNERGLLYALGQCDQPSLYTQPVETCIAVLDLESEQVQRRVTVEASASAALRLIDDTLYIIQRWSGDLYALDAETLSVTQTISEVIALDDDGAGARYALTPNTLLRLAPDPISQSLDYPFEGYGNQPIDIVASPEHIYVLGYKALSVFDTELNQVSVIDLNDLSPRELTLDRANDRLYIAAGTGLYAFEPDAGQVVLLYDEFPNILQVLIDAERDQLILRVHTPNDWFGGQRILVIDPSNSTSSNSSSSNGTTVRTLFSILWGSLTDLALDGDRNRLLVVSQANHALIPFPLEGAVTPAQRIPPGPQRIPLGVEVSDIAVDETTDRLFVSDSSGQVRVLDRRSYAEIARVYGGRNISLDPTHRRLYTGDAHAAVQVFDLDTLTWLRELPQHGTPHANPARDEVIIVERQFFVFDGATGEPRPNLLPGVGVPDAGCMGCYYEIASQVAVDTARGLTATITYTPRPGKPGPQQSITVDPLSGHAWYSLLTGGYIYQSSIGVYSDLSALQTGLRPAPNQTSSLPLRTVEGLSGYLAVDAPARRLYVARQNVLFVLDSETLDRLGRVEVDGWLPQILAVDGGMGRLYSADESRLIVWTRAGGAPPAPLPARTTVLTQTIESILTSPNFINDETLLALNEQKLCRSTDGGKTWRQLRGGLPSLPTYPLLRLTAAFSPDYANDSTIWAGGYIGDSHGEGVWQSTDGGDTWQCSSSGLLDLRTYRLFPSPNFKNDRTLLAYARGRNGDVLYRSTNGSTSWELVLRQTGYDQPPLSPPEAMFYIEQPQPLFKCDYNGICQRSDDRSKTWQPFDTGSVRLNPLVGYAVSPFFEGDRTVYFMAQSNLYRAGLIPSGDTVWERCTSPQFQDRASYTRYLTALAIAQTSKATYDLFIGTAAGEFYRVSPNELEWESLAAHAPVTPTSAPASTPTATQAPPTPTPCAGAVDERLLISYDSLPPQLGCAVEAGVGTTVAYQPFELGRMLWRADLRQIYVLQYDGTWAFYNDTWDESQPDRDPDIVPPEYFFQPMRGFGKLWREQLGGVEAWIGWATDQEHGYDTTIQAFSHGLLLWSGEENMLYVLYNDGAWDTAYQER